MNNYIYLFNDKSVSIQINNFDDTLELYEKIDKGLCDCKYLTGKDIFIKCSQRSAKEKIEKCQSIL